MRTRIVILAVLAVCFVALRLGAAIQEFEGTSLQTLAPGVRFGLQPEAGLVVVASPEPAANEETGGLRPGDVVREVRDDSGEGGSFASYFELAERLRAIEDGEPWSLVVERSAEDGTETERLVVEMPPMEPPERTTGWWARYLSIDVLVPAIYILAALLVGFGRPSHKMAFLAAIVFFMLSAVVGSAATFVPSWLRWPTFVASVIGPLWPVALLAFFLDFPRPAFSPRTRALLLTASTLAIVAIGVTEAARSSLRLVSFDAFFAATNLMNATIGREIRGMLQVPIYFVVVSAAMAAASLASQRAVDRDAKRRVQLVVWGATPGMVMLGVVVLTQFFGLDTPAFLFPILALLLGLFPLSMIYAIVRHRVFGIRLILRRGLQYLFVSRSVFVIEFLIVFWILVGPANRLVQAVLGSAGTAAASIGTALVALGLVAALQDLNRRLMPRIERRFFRESYDARQVLADFAETSRKLALRPRELLEQGSAVVAQSLYPQRIEIYLRDQPWSFWPRRPADDDTDRYVRVLTRTGIDATTTGTASFEPGEAFPVDDLLPDLSRMGASGGEVRILRTPLAAERRQPEDDEPPPAESGRASLDRGLTYLIVPLTVPGRVLGFFALGEKLSEEPYGREDEELLLELAGQLANALDYHELVGEAAEKERLESEMSIAKSVQERLFPAEHPAIEGLEYAGLCVPARGVGGDYFDYLRIGGGRLGLALGDITGKGISAALLMASLQAMLRSRGPTHPGTLATLVSSINVQLSASTDDNKFATFFLGAYCPKDRILEFVNAGHDAPILVVTDESGHPRVERLGPTGMVIGIFPDALFESARRALSPGDLLVIYSDGITEARNAEGEEFGPERLAELVLSRRDDELERLAEAIVRAARAHSGESGQADDMTVIVARALK